MGKELIELLYDLKDEELFRDKYYIVEHFNGASEGNFNIFTGEVKVFHSHGDYYYSIHNANNDKEIFTGYFTDEDELKESIELELGL